MTPLSSVARRLSLRSQAIAVVAALTLPIAGLATVLLADLAGVSSGAAPALAAPSDFRAGSELRERRALILMLLGSGLVVTLGLTGGLLVAGRISAAIRALSSQAAALNGEPGPVRRAAASLDALDDVNLAMQRASATIARGRSERDAAEARLRRSEQHLARAQKVADIGSFERSFNPDSIYWSDHIYEIYGVERGRFEPTAENIVALLHPDDREPYRTWRQFSAEESATTEYRIVRGNGEQRILRAERESIRDAAGTLVALVGTTRDITEARAAEDRHRELETQLRHSQRLEALGTLAGGIAHDLNNTLTPVVALPKRLARQFADQPSIRRQLELIEQAGLHARDLVKQILSFSRKDTPAKQRIDLAGFIDGLLPMIHATIPSTVRIEFSSPDDGLAVMGDPAQLRQVLVNLVANAVHAVGGETGTVTIALAAVRHDEVPSVRLSVCDTGHGMTQATLDRIFEPFFTTKGPGEGTGLGLSVVHGIIANHGGLIRATSAPGDGTQFEVILPEVAAPKAAAPEADARLAGAA